MSLTKCSFNPLDASMSCVSGCDSVKFFRITEKDIRPVHDVQLEGHNFTCHAWLRSPQDHVVAGTDNGDLILFRSGEYLCHLTCSPGQENPIYSILAIQQGIIVGSSKGKFFFFTLNPGESELSPNLFIKENSFNTDASAGNIKCLALSLTEETISAVTSENQIFIFPISAPSTIKNDDIKYLSCQFHSPKPITGMDVCIRKPIIITVSKDNSLRIWNYITMELDMVKMFTEEMLCATLHPSGFHAAVGFADKLRVYHILVDELRPCLEITIKNCRECRFSNGGNFIAAVNGNSINVFDFYSGEKIADLRGHNGKVRGLFWMPSGTQIVSCGQDGAVYLWDLEGCKRTAEFISKGTLYTSIACAGNSVFVVGNDLMIKELELPDLTLAKELDSGSILSCVTIAPTRSVMLAGSGEPGKPSSVRAYTNPVTGDYLEYPCLGSAISRLRVTPDESHVITTDESGCICVFEMKSQDRFQRGTNIGGENTANNVELKNEVLVTRAELEERHALIMELTAKVDELKLHNEYQMKLKEVNYLEKIKEITDKKSQELINKANKTYN